MGMGVMAIVLLCCAYTILRIQRQIVVHLPPDLHNSLVLQPGEIAPASVYAFALSVFQRLNFWKEDGSEDYLRQIKAHECYLTPQFKRSLQADIDHKHASGELRRGRGLFSLVGFEEARVQRTAPDTWEVRLDVGLREWVQARIVKDTELRYTLRVVRFDFSTECNPWGLALDAHAHAPVRI